MNDYLRQIAFTGGPDYATDLFLASGKLVSKVADTGIPQRPDLNDQGEIAFFDFGAAGEGVYRFGPNGIEPMAIRGDATPAGTIADFDLYNASLAISEASEAVFVASVESNGLERQGLLKALP